MGILDDLRHRTARSLSDGAPRMRAAWVAGFAAVALLFMILPQPEALRPYSLPFSTAALLAAAFVLGPRRGAVAGALAALASWGVFQWRLVQRFPEEFAADLGPGAVAYMAAEAALTGLATAAFVALAALLARWALQVPPRLSLGALWALASSAFLLVVGGSVALVGWSTALGAPGEGWGPPPTSALPLTGVALALVAAVGVVAWRRGAAAFDGYTARILAGVAALYLFRIPYGYLSPDLLSLLTRGRTVFIRSARDLELYAVFAITSAPASLFAALLATLVAALLVGWRAPGAVEGAAGADGAAEDDMGVSRA